MERNNKMKRFFSITLLSCLLAVWDNGGGDLIPFQETNVLIAKHSMQCRVSRPSQRQRTGYRHRLHNRRTNPPPRHQDRNPPTRRPAVTRGLLEVSVRLLSTPPGVCDCSPVMSFWKSTAKQYMDRTTQRAPSPAPPEQCT